MALNIKLPPNAHPAVFIVMETEIKKTPKKVSNDFCIIGILLKNKDIYMSKQQLLKVIFALSFQSTLFQSCDLFEYHPYAKNISGEKQVLEKQQSEIESICEGKDTICFAFITDTQGGYDELNSAIRIINKMDEVQFVIHGGDQTDFGLIKEFEWCRNSMNKLNKPYCIVIGNHDCIGTGEYTFRTIFGSSDYSFNAGFCHFLCLNTVALEYDYSNPVPNLEFIETDFNKVDELNIDNDSIKHTVVIMHAPPFCDQFNNNVAKPFEYYLRRFPGAKEGDDRYTIDSDTLRNQSMKHAFCVFGHIHTTGIYDFFNDGLLYYSCTNIISKQFLIFTITKEGYECEQIDY